MITSYMDIVRGRFKEMFTKINVVYNLKFLEIQI